MGNMTFESGGERYSIYFTYGKHDGKREVGCVIKSQDDDNYASGSSLCSEGDRFVKEVGREIALERALRFAIKKRGKRADFWDSAMRCYHNRRKPGSRQVAV